MSAKERTRKTEITMLKDMIRQFATKFYKICALKLVSIKMQTKTGECVHVRCGDHDKKKLPSCCFDILTLFLSLTVAITGPTANPNSFSTAL